MTVCITLTQGKTATVDDIDQDLAALRWYAGKFGEAYYAMRGIRQPRHTVQYLHRVIGARKAIVGQVDHKNRNPLDCTRDNLRAATSQQNNANRSIAKNNASGVKGVNWRADRGDWEARVMVAGKRTRLGYFADLDTAKDAVRKHRALACGDFACDG